MLNNYSHDTFAAAFWQFQFISRSLPDQHVFAAFSLCQQTCSYGKKAFFARCATPSLSGCRNFPPGAKLPISDLLFICWSCELALGFKVCSVHGSSLFFERWTQIFCKNIFSQTPEQKLAFIGSHHINGIQCRSKVRRRAISCESGQKPWFLANGFL